MTHDENFDQGTQQTHAQVTRGQSETDIMRNKEKMITSQQTHDINSLNGENNECDMCEAQTLADAMCDFNKTFKNEENFTNSWQQSHKDERCETFSDEIEELMNNKTMHE